ncbi:MAG TPA: CBASS cGAMP-activated phospholipase [Pyrinomonadaceae bacterium]|jgi:patatin-like phospholipase/acyl hydrolase
MKVLSIDGGGYLGLATAAFIAKTESQFGISFHKEFDLFCGTSTGAIISLALANGMSGAKIVELYKDLGQTVFRNPFPGARALRFAKSFLTAKYSNKPLKKALKKAFGDKTIGDIYATDKKVLITAFSLTNGTPRIFKTDHHHLLTTDKGWLLRDVALASAAAPTYFPIAKLVSPDGNEERYCDGGVFSNHPALLGYAEAVSHLGIDPDNVRVLSLSTPRSDLAEQRSLLWALKKMPSRGILMWSNSLPAIFVDGNSMISHEILRRVMAWTDDAKSRYIRISFKKPNGVDMDIVNKYATDTLEQTGNYLATKGDIKDALKGFWT